MPYVAREDVVTTPRRSLSSHKRLRAWERHCGVCIVCGEQIDGLRQRWIVEHIRALELGGADDLENMAPAHQVCAIEKTRDDHARTAKAKRQKISYLGVTVVVRPIPGSRINKLNCKIGGEVVLRSGLGRRSVDCH